MILTHYDNTYIECTDEQFYNLETIFQIIEEDGLEYISPENIIEAFYENDDIYYSGKFLFESIKTDNLMIRYCNLVVLIYSYFYKVDEKIDATLMQILENIWYVY